MQGSLKNRTISGMLWSGVGKIGTMMISFISNLILARLLMPSDFGCIGMLYVFIAISGVFISGGLGSALIQKQNIYPVDYTTVFYWNLTISILFYFILYFAAPIIANFYSMPLLRDVLRVQGLSLIIQSFSIVQSTQLQKQLRFRELTISNIVSSLLGIVFAIVLAFGGYGIWSLVASTIVSSLMSVILLWKMSSWRPTWEFSFKSLSILFNFGGLMLLSSLIETIYTNLQSLVIGKWYSAKDLGFFTQAQKLQEVPTNALSSIVNEVSFPVFSEIQHDKALLLNGLRKNISAITYLNFPLMVLLVVVSEPLILLLYGNKWESSIPYFQILCVSSMIYTLNTLNTNVIKSLGRSKIFFFVQLVKRLIGVLLIIVGAKFSVYGILWGMAFLGYICFFINATVVGKLIDYGVIKQIKDIIRLFLFTILLGICVFFIGSSIHRFNIYLVMSVQITIYIGLYLIFSRVFNVEGFEIYREILKSRIQR